METLGIRESGWLLTDNWQLTTDNGQPSTVNRQRSTVNRKPSTVNCPMHHFLFTFPLYFAKILPYSKEEKEYLWSSEPVVVRDWQDGEGVLELEMKMQSRWASQEANEGGTAG